MNDDEFDRRLSDGLHRDADGFDPDASGARRRFLGRRAAPVRVPTWALATGLAVVVAAGVATPALLRSNHAGRSVDRTGAAPTDAPSSHDAGWTEYPACPTDSAGDMVCTLTAMPAHSPSPAFAGSATVAASPEPVTPSPRPSSSPVPTPTVSATAPSGDVTVGRDDNNRHIVLRRGQRLIVQLDGGWTVPESSNEAIVRRDGGKEEPDYSSTHAEFTALAAGTADVSASSDAACFHTEPRCMMPSMLWQVHVTVTP